MHMWPADPTTVRSMAFAPTVTPATFIKRPLPAGMLFPPTDVATSPTRPRRKKCKSHIPRSSNAFILFRANLVKNRYISSTVEPCHSALSKIAGEICQILPQHEREIWGHKAVLARDEHKQKFPEYKFCQTMPPTGYQMRTEGGAHTGQGGWPDRDKH